MLSNEVHSEPAARNLGLQKLKLLGSLPMPGKPQRTARSLTLHCLPREIPRKITGNTLWVEYHAMIQTAQGILATCWHHTFADYF